MDERYSFDEYCKAVRRKLLCAYGDKLKDRAAKDFDTDEAQDWIKEEYQYACRDYDKETDANKKREIFPKSVDYISWNLFLTY